MEPILRAEGLTRHFQDRGRETVAAVDQVSFSLYPGETLGIVGESGSGKSTLAKLLLRLTPAQEGKIFLEGQEITAASGKELREVYEKLQLVFQSPMGSFDPRRTLGDGVGETLRNRGFSKGQTEEVVKRLFLQCELPEELISRYPRQVSGGQCQRAAIARALASQPKVLVCDEATSALDVTVQKQILGLLGRLKEERGLSYLFICHDLALVQDFCDRVLVMQEGKIVEGGTPDQVIQRPQSAYTKQLVEAAF